MIAGPGLLSWLNGATVHFALTKTVREKFAISPARVPKGKPGSRCRNCAKELIQQKNETAERMYCYSHLLEKRFQGFVDADVRLAISLRTMGNSVTLLQKIQADGIAWQKVFILSVAETALINQKY